MTVELLDRKASTSVVWGLWFVLVVIGMFYLGFYGFHNENLTAVTVFAISVMMLLTSTVMSRFRLFTMETSFVRSAQAWFIGFVIWLVIGSLGNEQGSTFAVFSSVSVGPSQLFSSLSGQLDPQWAWFLNNVVNPIVEESFWAVGLPIFLTEIMDGMGKIGSLGFMRNKIVQMAILIPVLSISFAIFHVGKLVFVFIVSALIFRAILTVLWWGDVQFNLIPTFVILPSFLVGSHMGNNIGAEGIVRSISIMISHPIGWLTGFIFLLFAVIAITSVTGRIAKLIL